MTNLTFKDYFFPYCAVVGIVVALSLCQHGMTMDAFWQAGCLFLWFLAGSAIAPIDNFFKSSNFFKKR